MTAPASDVARIEAEIAATKARIGAHLDELKSNLSPAEIVQDVAAAGFAAARKMPGRLNSKTVLSALAALGGVALLLTLRGSSRALRPLPQSA